MDGEELLDAVETANETALARLGSERALVAVTSAAIDRATVLETSAAAEARAVATFEDWAADEDDERTREAFTDAAERERDHLERVLDLADGNDPDGDALTGTDPEPDALHEHLRTLDGTAERVGAGLLARPLVASRTLLQVINFFVNEGDSRAADVFRDLRAETDEQASDGAVLAAKLADDAFLAATTASADRAIEVAYEEYTDRLTSMGVDPKPVC